MSAVRVAIKRGKGRIRGVVKRGSRDGGPRVEARGRFREPSVCQACGAVFMNRTWRRSPARRLHAFLTQAAWVTCPACEQVQAGVGFGRVRLRGPFVADHTEELRRRILHVAARARFTQPERQLVSLVATPAGIEVVATSQKLAHRIVHEIKKTFRGRASYHWSSGDGSLDALWER